MMEVTKYLARVILDHICCLDFFIILFLFVFKSETSPKVEQNNQDNGTSKVLVDEKDKKQGVVQISEGAPSRRASISINHEKVMLSGNMDSLQKVVPIKISKKTTRVSIKEDGDPVTIVKWVPNFNHMAEIIMKHYRVLKLHTRLRNSSNFNVFSYLLLHLHIAFYYYLKTISKFDELNRNFLDAIKLYESQGFNNLKIIPNLRPWFENLGGAESTSYEKIRFEPSLPPRKEPLIRNPFPQRIDFNAIGEKAPVEKYDCHLKEYHNSDFHLHVYCQAQAILDGYYSHTTTELFPNFGAILLAAWFVFSSNSIDKRRFISANSIQELEDLDQGNVRISFSNIVGGSMEFDKVDDSFAYIARDTLIDFNDREDINDDIVAYLNITPRLLRHLNETATLAESVSKFEEVETGVWEDKESLVCMPVSTTAVKAFKPGLRSAQLNEMCLQEFTVSHEVISKFKDVDDEHFYDTIATTLVWDNSNGITPGFFYKDDNYYYYDRRSIDEWFSQGTLYHSEVYNRDSITSNFKVESIHN